MAPNDDPDIAAGKPDADQAGGGGDGSPGPARGPATPDPTAVEEFMRLFGAHRRRLYQFILSLVPNVQDAEDVLQETNIILWRKFGGYQPG